MPTKGGLTDKQRAFAREYVHDFNGAAAAIRAGYSAKCAKRLASQAMKVPAVLAEIDRLTQAKAARADMKDDEVVEQLTNIIRADVRDVLEWGFSTVTQKDPAGNEAEFSIPFVHPIASADLPRSISCAVAEVSQGKDGTFKVKMHDKIAAIDKLMRHLGMFEKDNKQVADGLADLIAAAQGTTIPIATHRDGDDG